MPCFHPAQVWPARPPARGIVWRRSDSFDGARSLEVPCGQCIGCRLARSQDWATRIAHEAQMHDDNMFLTLTFNDEELPWDRSVSVRDVQLFMKRLRKMVGKVRFFACGEYGARLSRPHYHLIVFGHRFTDLVPWRRTSSGFVVSRSPSLERLWKHGFSEVGEVTHQSAAYVARYVVKKVTGSLAKEHYSVVHPETGEVSRVAPEFICMSTHPGIGAEWLAKYRGDAFPSDFVVVDGKRRPVPRYYVKKQEDWYQDEVKYLRSVQSEKSAANRTPERLAVREEVQEMRVERLQREYESE